MALTINPGSDEDSEIDRRIEHLLATRLVRSLEPDEQREYEELTEQRFRRRHGGA